MYLCSRLVLICFIISFAYANTADSIEDSEEDSEWEELVALQRPGATREELMSEFIQRHNEEYDNGEHSFRLRESELTRLTRSQYQRRLGFRRAKGVEDDGFIFQMPDNAVIPDELDWRDYEVVTHVKQQGHCGSCYAFAATGALEARHARTRGYIVELSEQNIIDCDHNERGCHGGDMLNVFGYIQKNGGIDVELAYPYEAEQGRCRFNRSSVGATDNGFYRIQSGDEEHLKRAVAIIGPIAVSFDANSILFNAYGGGVYYNEKCSSDPDLLTHAMLVVGYGTDPVNGEYWLVKNSWGTSYGEDGYIRTARNRGNNCGIASRASYPTV